MTTDPHDAPDAPMPDMPRDAERTRGRYVRLRDGRPTGMEERFVLGEIAPGVVRVRSTLISPSPVGRLETDTRLSAGSVDVRLRWTGSGDGVARDAEANYRWVDGVVTATRRVAGNGYPDAEAAGTLDPGGLLFQGLLVANGRAGVDLVLPDTTDACDPGTFLALLRVHAVSTVVGETEVRAAGALREGAAYRWEAAGVGPDVVLDHGGLLLSQTLEGADARYDAHLVDLTGPWPRPLDWPR